MIVKIKDAEGDIGHRGVIALKYAVRQMTESQMRLLQDSRLAYWDVEHRLHLREPSSSEAPSGTPPSFHLPRLGYLVT